MPQRFRDAFERDMLIGQCSKNADLVLLEQRIEALRWIHTAAQCHRIDEQAHHALCFCKRTTGYRRAQHDVVLVPIHA
ncbi:hypothetical protein D3C71_1110970 [compost metagenome]